MAHANEYATRSNAETEVLALNRLLQQVTAQVPGMVYQYRLRPDGSSCFPYLSDGIRDLLPITPEEVRDDARPALAFIHPEDLAGVLAAVEKSALTGRLWQQRFRIQVGNTPPRWLQGRGMPQREADGGCLWHGFLTDVTQEVAAEESQRIAASVFAHAQEGITITDAGGFILDVNPAFTRITGYTRDEVLGRSPKMLSSGHQDAAFYAHMWQSIAATGGWRGEVWNRNKAGEVYPELLSIAVVKDAAGLISHYIGTFSDITHLKEREAQLDRLAHYDPLTSLPNRRLLTERLRQAIAQTKRAGKIMAICVLDLDGFKPINDTHGHAVGDRMLVEVAQRLSACVRDGDTVARLGGDEFVVLLQNLEWVEECDGVLSRLLAELAAPLPLDRLTLRVGASIGVSLYPQDGNAQDVLLQHADQAMYQAKQAGRNRYQLFNPEHDRLVRDYRRLVEDLAVALQEDQFVLHYQPKVNLVVGMAVGAEALIRWRHPERGLLSPAEFLYATKHAELDIQLDHWVLAQVLKQIERWKAEGTCLPISINLSPRTLLDKHFIAHLDSALALHPTVLGGDLEIELLESGELVTEERATTAIKSCQALGVRVVLDDFGTGQSTPAYFRHLPVDMLKIDQGFVRDMCVDAEDLAIVEGIIKIAKGFNREVVAKGVETTEQGMRLTQLGCHIAQGYAIARPMPADSMVHWLANWSGPTW